MFDQLEGSSDDERKLLTAQRDKLEAERLKLVQAHYADAIPLDLLKSEQDRIRANLDQITTWLDNLTDTYAEARTGLDQLTELLVDLDDLYNKCEPAERRILNSPASPSMPRPKSPQKQNCPASFLAGQTSHVVELGGFEPPTFSLRTRRATNCAIAPSTDRS